MGSILYSSQSDANMRILLSLLSIGLVSCLPQSRYLAPERAASEANTIYSSPDDVFGAASEDVVFTLSASDSNAVADEDLSSTVEDVIFTLPSEEAATSYGSPLDDIISLTLDEERILSSPSEEVAASYGSPRDNAVLASPSEKAVARYGAPVRDALSSAPSETVSSYRSYQDNNVGSESRINNVAVRPQVKIVRNEFSGPNDGNWNYAYESENGIRQEARGEMRSIGNELVNVMSGSYSYVGPDGLTYQVDWYADETGFHPSAPHLPKPVEIPFPEQAAAVADQLRFAAEQDAAAAASNTNSVSVALDSLQYDDLAGYGSDDLAGYGSDDLLSGYGS